MTPSRLFKIAGGWIVGIAVVLGWSYFSEWPKYRFERVAAEAGQTLPGARLIGQSKVVEIGSPITWFWPLIMTWNFAMPDPIVLDRFYTVTMIYDEEQPIIFLQDVDCKARNVIFYDLDQPESAFPARDQWGEPVVAPNGKTYRQLKTTIPPSAEHLHAFCDTDWSAERKAVRSLHPRAEHH